MIYELLSTAATFTLGGIIVFYWFREAKLLKEIADYKSMQKNYASLRKDYSRDKWRLIDKLDEVTGEHWMITLQGEVYNFKPDSPLGEITEKELENPDVFFGDNIDTSKTKIILGAHHTRVRKSPFVEATNKVIKEALKEIIKNREESIQSYIDDMEGK